MTTPRPEEIRDGDGVRVFPAPSSPFLNLVFSGCCMFVRAVTSMFNILPTPARHLSHAFCFVKGSYSYRRAANSIALYIVIPPLILHTFVGLGTTRNESRICVLMSSHWVLSFRV